jgi:hypothetical protein
MITLASFSQITPVTQPTLGILFASNTSLVCCMRKNEMKSTNKKKKRKEKE